MKKRSTYIAVRKVLNTFSVKIFLVALMLLGRSFDSHATAWTTGTAGDVTVLANWTNGATSPTSFTTPGDTWTINLAMTQSSSSTSWIVGTIAMSSVTVTFATGGTLSLSGAGTTYIDTIYGNVVISGGTFTLGGAGTAANVYVYGNYSISSGTVSSTGAGSDFITNIYGNYSMTGGNYSSAGSTTVINNNIYGNCSYSGACAMTCTGAGATSTVHLSLPTGSGTMLADNTSTGAAWSKTNIYIDAGCTAQLDGNFSVSTSGPSITTAGSFGVNVNGTLICPAAYDMYGTGAFIVNAGATLKVANAAGINGAVTGTGTRTFNTAANYVFNGSVAQVTGAYLPAALVTPDTITISNSAGVTLTNPTSTTGTLLFTSGILYTGSGSTMSTPGTAGAVVGAGATSYVDGTLVKTITGLTSVNYEVGDLDYVPMNLSFSVAGTGGSLGVMTTNGLHPSMATSGFLTTNIVNHYWTVSNYGATGPVTVTPKAIYNLPDIIGGSNAIFLTQEYTGAWLGSPLASTNTSAPYSTTPNTGIPIATLPGDYIFGTDCTTLPITGNATICTGGGMTTTLSDATASGIWSSSNTAVATIDPGGTVHGITTGITTISYTAGCPSTLVVSVGTLPISAPMSTLCAGTTLPLNDLTPGGVWSSSNTNVVTVSATGVVYAVSVASANISYTLSSCPGDAVGYGITVVTLASITGGPAVCLGSPIMLSDATAGGAWSSSNTFVATVSGSGSVTGTGFGTATITYTYSTCSVYLPVTVGTMPITGTTTVCAGSTTTLSDGSPGGVWSSSTSGVATVSSSSGVVYGVTNGTATILYTYGACPAVSTSVSVVTLSAVTPATATLCVGSTTTLSDGTASGAWSSSNNSIATVDAAGMVTGAGPGTTTIVYTLGSCTASATVTVSGALSPITGTAAACIGSTTALTDATTGGVWSSSNTGVATIDASGVVHGVTSGTTNISYTTGSCAVGIAVTIGVLPAITGPVSVCAGSNITLSDAAPSGVWSSGSVSAATISGSGVVYGVASGTTTISYTLSGCTVTTVISVGSAISPITGNTTLCTGATTTLSDASTGGVWSSGNTAVATVSGSVVVYGASQGTATISYTIGGCSASTVVTVNAGSAGTITGKDSICKGGAHEIMLSDVVSGGVWSSTNTSRATVDPVTGVVTGTYAGSTVGVDTIKYTVTNSCGTFVARFILYIRTAAQCATGVDPVAETELTTLKVFPNPNRGVFTINLLSAVADEEVHVVIMNIVGEKVREFITTTNKATEVKLDPAAGIYLLSATTAEGRYMAKVEVE